MKESKQGRKEGWKEGRKEGNGTRESGKRERKPRGTHERVGEGGSV